MISNDKNGMYILTTENGDGEMIRTLLLKAFSDLFINKESPSQTNESHVKRSLDKGGNNHE